MTKIFISAILVLLLVSCHNNRVQDKPKPETPKALEDNSSSYEIIPKRGNIDIIESLYGELLTKNADLKKLEDKIEELNKSKADTTNLFDKFNEKNQSYFRSANRHIEEIADSTLRDKMKVLIANNLIKYNSSIERHNEFLKVIESKRLAISDLHNILKIVKTLPLIDKYQSENIPNTKPFEGYIKQQEEAIKLADTLSKK
jgi:hypothetical protein